MDADAVNNIAQALQALAAAVQNLQAQAAPAAPAAAAPAVPTQVSPYEGDALDLTSRAGTSLFIEGSKTLDSKFTGKVEDLHLFLGALRQQAHTCCWLGGTHDIFTVPVGGVDLNLLTDYGRITATDVETARAAWVAGADVRGKQNLQMMYECIFATVTDNTKSNLSTLQNMDDTLHTV